MATITLGRYCLLSVVATLAVLWHAFSSRRQYFAAMYYLGTSKLSIAVLGNFGFMLALLFYKLVTVIYLGRLRESEMERITERLHHGIVEICLTLTVFRQDFDTRLVILMGVLALIKVFHWLIQDRINYIQTESIISRVQHLRIVSFLSILLVLDVLFVRSSVRAIRNGDKGYQLLFMFEYAILACIAIASFIKYSLAVIDNAMTEHWENKGLYILYLELGMDIANFVLYVAFFAMIMHKYVTIPLHLIRDIYMAYVSLVKRVTNYIRYRSVTSKIHQLMDATDDDLQRVGGSCIICREDMALSEGLKKLRCGHVFHLACLRSWLERQQTCPICRNSILPSAAETAAETRAAQSPEQGAAQGADAAGGAADRAPNDPGAAAAPTAQNGPAAGEGPTMEQNGLRTPVPLQDDGAAAPVGGVDHADTDAGMPNQREPTGSGASGAAVPQAPTAEASAGRREGPSIQQPEVGSGTSGSTGLAHGSGGDSSTAAGGASTSSAMPDFGMATGVRGRPMGGMRSRTVAPGMTTQGLPHEATPEMRAAFQAASKAFASMAPYYMPIYQPFGTGVPTTPTEEITSVDAAATAPVGPMGETQARAQQVASAAVAASIAATKQLLQGHIAVLSERLSSLETVEESASGRRAGTSGTEDGGGSAEPNSSVS